jgi:hypothetical protein
MKNSMTDQTTPLPLIRTKLQRPPAGSDHLPHLLKRLDQRLQRPLTHIAAQVRYGRSS